MNQPAEIEAMGPWLQMAVICQTGLIESNGNLSIIRVFDRMVLPVANAETSTVIQVTLAIVFKSGAMSGMNKIGVQPIAPTKGNLPPMVFQALFEGAERGVQLVLPIGFPIQEEGLYWFDISVNDQRYTRIPLRDNIPTDDASRPNGIW